MEMLNTSEAAEYCGFPSYFLRNLRHRGKGARYYKITGRTVLYEKSDLDEWLKSIKVEPNSNTTSGMK